MAGERHDFHRADGPEPHRDRTKAILRDHPQIRTLIGRNPWSLALILGVVTTQVALAWVLTSRPWWLLIAVAWLVGAFLSHSLYVLIHEAAHNLILPRRWQNYVAAILADLPNVFPAAISFRRYHLKHHSFQGIYLLDADIPSRWEARLVGSGVLGKSLWLLFFPLFQLTRPPRLKEIRFVSRWTVLNWISVALFDVAVVVVLGPKALLYLLASAFFGVGLHPLGARWIQEHFLTDDPQETYSYYGWLNRIAMNVGFHNEHHDFPSVPWNRLPRVRDMAPEYYRDLVFHGSWSGLLLRFLFDPELTLFSRMVRDDRGGVALGATRD